MDTRASQETEPAPVMRTGSDPMILLVFLQAALPLWGAVLTVAGWLAGTRLALPDRHTGAVIGSLIGLGVTACAFCGITILRYHQHLHARPLDGDTTSDGE